MSECKPCDLAKNFLCSMNKDQKCLFTLISINVIYGLLSIFHINILSFALYSLMGYLLFNIVKTKLGYDAKSCCDSCFTEEKLKECYYNFHDKLNSFFDSIRNVIFLNDITLLIKVVITLLFVIYLGHSFSSPATILISKYKNKSIKISN